VDGVKLLNIARLFTGLKKQFIIFLFFILICSIVFSQKPQFSLATDLSILRSFKNEQRYWAVGQTIHFHFHISPKDGAYAWFSYYSDGKFTNALAAAAKSPGTVPQQVNYLNNAELSFKQVSLGWKRYLKGTFNSEKEWNLYGYAGFGLMMGRILNTHSVVIDSSVYFLPVLSGKANFKRLTLDLGLGLEFPVGGDIYLYLEGRALVPTTDYPSSYLFINNNTPFTGAVNAGFRILFE
jgi:hypothetical protein